MTMTTDQLIALLATQAPAVPPQAARRRLGWALAAGLPVSVLLLWLEFGLRSDLASAWSTGVMWLKQAGAVGLAVAGLLAAHRLGRPGVPAGRAAWLLGVTLALLWAAGLATWIAAPADLRAELLWGRSWRSCPFNIAGLSLPLLLALLVALRGLAPTRPALAGAAAGVAASGLATAVYALHCPESSALFVAVWYVLGMAIAPAVGALLGPRALRW